MEQREQEELVMNESFYVTSVHISWKISGELCIERVLWKVLAGNRLEGEREGGWEEPYMKRGRDGVKGVSEGRAESDTSPGGGKRTANKG